MSIRKSASILSALLLGSLGSLYNTSVSASGSSSPITVYQHINFRGSSLSVGEGDVTIQDLRASSVRNDRISSIRIAAGYEVYACQNSRLRGRCETFTGDVSDLRQINFNDVISSLRVSRVTPPVTVHQHSRFTGNSLGINEGTTSINDLRNSGVGNDRITSIQVASGYAVTACQHSNLNGRCETFTRDISSLGSIGFDNVVSSLLVRRVSSQPSGRIDWGTCPCVTDAGAHPEGAWSAVLGITRQTTTDNRPTALIESRIQNAASSNGPGSSSNDFISPGFRSSIDAFGSTFNGPEVGCAIEEQTDNGFPLDDNDAIDVNTFSAVQSATEAVNDCRAGLYNLYQQPIPSAN